jgi:hypothetical protein
LYLTIVVGQQVKPLILKSNPRPRAEDSEIGGLSRKPRICFSGSTNMVSAIGRRYSKIRLSFLTTEALWI